MATMNDFLNSYLGLQANKRQNRAAEVAEAHAMAQQVAAAQAIIQNTDDPEQQVSLARSLGETFGIGDQFAKMVETLSPSVQAMRNKVTAEGVPNLTEGEQKETTLANLGVTGGASGAAQSTLLAGVIGEGTPNEEWQQAFLQRMLTGQTPGQFATDELLSESPLAQQIALRLAIDPATEWGLEQGDTQLGLMRRGQTLDYNVGVMGIQQRAAEMELDYLSRMAAARQKAVQEGDEEAIKLMEQITDIEKLIQQGNMNRDAIAQQRTLQKDFYRRLVEKGHTQFQPFAEMDVTEQTRNTFVPGPGYKWLGSRGPGNW